MKPLLLVYAALPHPVAYIVPAGQGYDRVLEERFKLLLTVLTVDLQLVLRLIAFRLVDASIAQKAC